MTIDDIQLFRLRIPLSRPYKLVFRDVAWFDTLLVWLVVDGQQGLGEATILNGYTEETVEGSWMLAASLTEKLCGRSAEEASQYIKINVRSKAPFVATAFQTAIEAAHHHPILDVNESASVPVVYGINAIDLEGIEHELERALAAGFRTLKIKVGFSLNDDLARIKLIQRLNRGRAILRVDANQGYSQDDGCAFASSVSPESIELLEQPCHAKDWNAARAVIEASGVPVMLDESIYEMDDIDRAARIGAKFVKLKLMKCGSLTVLVRGIDRIRELGMRPVLGNGVASDISCWMEACVASTKITNAGEMNGYLRQRESLASNPVPVEIGAMQLQPGSVPILSEKQLNQATVDQVTKHFSMARENAPFSQQ